MISPPRISTILKTALVLFVGLFVFGESSARAECGDYVTINGQKPMAHNDASDESPGKPACNGPHCQKQAPFTPLPDFPTKNRIPSDPASLVQATELPGQSQLLLLEIQLQVPSALPFLLLDPPK